MWKNLCIFAVVYTLPKVVQKKTKKRYKYE